MSAALTKLVKRSPFLGTIFYVLILSLLYVQATQAASPYAEWRFDENAWSGGSDIIDSSGNGHTAKALGGITTVSGGKSCRGGYVTDDDGSTSDVNAIDTDVDVNSIGNTGSIGFWYKLDFNASGSDRELFDGSVSYIFGIFDDEFMLQLNNNRSLTLKMEDSSFFFPTVVEFSTSSNLVPKGDWAHIVATWDFPNNSYQIYVDSVLEASDTTSTTSSLDGFQDLYIGDSTSFSAGPGDSADGIFDQVKIYQQVLSQSEVNADYAQVDDCAISLDHFYISHDGTGLTCEAESVTIFAHDASHNDINLDSSYTMTINTDTNNGGWILTSGSGSLSESGSTIDGAASYQWGNESSVQLALKNVMIETTNINLLSSSITENTGNASGDSPNDSSIVFSDTGFRFIDSGGSTLANQIAGTNSATYYLQAIKTSETTGICTGLFSDGADVSVELGSTCVNPSSCISGQQLSFNNNAATTLLPNPQNQFGGSNYRTVSLRFGSDSKAAFTMNYPDVGNISLNAQYNLLDINNNPTGVYISGNSSFIVKPFDLYFDEITNPADTLTNPAAANASGSKFIVAGQTFRTVVQARNAFANLTPNYGNETSAEGITLTHSLVAPAGQDSGSLNNMNAFSVGTAGEFTNTTVTWNEVGIINLDAGVADGDYLGAGSVTAINSGNIGRFYPDRFDLSIANAPSYRDGTGTWSCGFTYQGQNFTYASTAKPIVLITAYAEDDSVTANYGDTYWKLNGSQSNRTYANTQVSAGGTFSSTLNGLAVLSSETDFDGDGLVTLPSDALVYNKTASSAGINDVPYNASATFTLSSADLTDSDGVCYDSADIGSCDDFTSPSITGTSIRYGRLSIDNASGSELASLPTTARAEYYAALGSQYGFITNTLDNNLCTGTDLSGISVDMSNYTGNLSSGETTPSFGAMSSGIFILTFSAPGTGNAGGLLSTLNLSGGPTWLRYNFIGSGDIDPFATINFGLFQGEDLIIFQRETYR